MSISALRTWMLVAALATGGAAIAAAATPTLAELAGRYTDRFKNGNIDGDVYYTTNVVEVFPVDRSKALVRLDLSFFNGHSCYVRGAARFEGRKLVYREKSKWLPKEAPCALSIWKEGSNLRWEDEGTCHFNCGARGGFSNGRIAYSSRRPLKRPPSYPPR